MKTINIKKISEDWGGDNLLFTIHVDEKKDISMLKNIDNIDDLLFKINREGELDFEWDCEISYDNMDYNGYFFKTVFIDKDNLCHEMIGETVVITDNFIIDLIEGDCEMLLKKIKSWGE